MMRYIALPAALGAFLTSHQVDAFSTPRTSAGLAAPSRGSLVAGDVSISIDGTEQQQQRCIINGQPRVNGMCLFAESPGESEGSAETSDDDDELETEASTTGLFIPGFSDKFAEPEDEKKKEPEKPKPVPEVKKPEPVVVKKEEPVKVEPKPAAKVEPVAAKAPEAPKSEAKKPVRPDLSEDVSKSIIDLPSLPSLPKISLPFGSKDPTPPSKPPPSGDDAIAAALGGAVYGAAAGLYADVVTDVLLDTDLPALVPPAALGAAVGAAAFVGVNQGGIVGTVAKFIFAGPVNYVKNGITSKIDQTVDDIKSTPKRIQDAAVKKVEDTVDEIKVRELLVSEMVTIVRM